MTNLVYLRDLVVILAVALAVVTILHRFRIPTIAGFILAGILVGPHGLGLVNDVHKVENLAEIGVALLLFGIGLELSFERLRRLWRPILVGGFLQVGLTILATFALSRLLNFSSNTSLFLGFLVAVSSTAIVLRGLEERGEVDAPHGRLTLGILVFQDLCVVPMMLTIPLLSGSGPADQDILSLLLRAAAIIIGVVAIARLVIPYVLRLIARTRQRHLFVLAVVLVSIGTAWVISSSGVSLALGAFMAGIVVAGSEYRHQALADLIPFREVFAALFFVSVGMLLHVADILQNIVPIIILVVAILFGKFTIVFLTGLIMRLPLSVSVLAAAALAQIGEFSFVLQHTAQGTGLLEQQTANYILMAAILSMLVTPFGFSLGPHVAAGMGKVRMLNRLLKVATAEDAVKKTRTMKDHVIIGGYGFAGQQLAQALEGCRILYLIADLNTENVRKASLEGRPAYFGDITSPDVLERLGAANARELVLVINDPGAVERAVKAARHVTTSLHITVRTRYMLDVESLIAAGANEVIPAEREAAVEVVSRVLSRCKPDPSRVAEQLARIRERNEDEDM